MYIFKNAINKFNFTMQVLYIHELICFVCDPLSTHYTKCTCSIKNLCFIGLALQVNFFSRSDRYVHVPVLHMYTFFYKISYKPTFDKNMYQTY